MNTFGFSKTLAVLLLALPATLACEVEQKQIGQLDDEAGSEGETSEDSQACIDALGFLQEVFAELQGEHCAFVLLFDYETYELSNWNVECETGDLGMSVDEARELTTWGGQDISGDEPADRSFLFYTSVEDAAGVGWVSNHVGLLFDASIVAAGIGEIHHPSIMRDPSELGTGCVYPGWAFEWRGYDLTEEPVVVDLHLANTEPLWAALHDTAVVRAVVADATPDTVITRDVVAYPRTIADFDPSAAEYVIVFEWTR
jgi:hypothetical protein